MGIDYGRGTEANRNSDTGIRYGIVSCHLINQDMLEFFTQPDLPPTCPECGTEFDPDHIPTCCTNCRIELRDREEDLYPSDYDGPFYYEDAGYSLMLDSARDVWVFKSPWKTLAGFCSPCAPGAVYLTDRTPDAWGYCLGLEWFNNEVAPYEMEVA